MEKMWDFFVPLHSNMKQIEVVAENNATVTSDISLQTSAFRHQPSDISLQTSAIRHLPSALSHSLAIL